MISPTSVLTNISEQFRKVVRQQIWREVADCIPAILQCVLQCSSEWKNYYWNVPGSAFAKVITKGLCGVYVYAYILIVAKQAK